METRGQNQTAYGLHLLPQGTNYQRYKRAVAWLFSSRNLYPPLNLEQPMKISITPKLSSHKNYLVKITAVFAKPSYNQSRIHVCSRPMKLEIPLNKFLSSQVPGTSSSGNFKFRNSKIIEKIYYLQKSFLVGKTVWYPLLILSAVD